MIYDFLNIHFNEKGINVTNFMISTAFPKADLTNMEATVLDLVSKFYFIFSYHYSIFFNSIFFLITLNLLICIKFVFTFLRNVIPHHTFLFYIDYH